LLNRSAADSKARTLDCFDPAAVKKMKNLKKDVDICGKLWYSYQALERRAAGRKAGKGP
jgi:hypothetical protein